MISTPAPVATADMPVGSTPMKFPATVLLVAVPDRKRTHGLKPLITRPRMIVLDVATSSPTPPESPEPLNWILRTALSPIARVFGLQPGWVYPSMVTAAVIAGREVAGLIVWTPEPEMSKAIVLPE